jgi:hypothetical protein
MMVMMLQNQDRKEKKGLRDEVFQNKTRICSQKGGSGPVVRHYQAWRHTEVAAEFEAGG